LFDREARHQRSTYPEAALSSDVQTQNARLRLNGACAPADLQQCLERTRRAGNQVFAVPLT
jgi:hypothetical protein